MTTRAVLLSLVFLLGSCGVAGEPADASQPAASAVGSSTPEPTTTPARPEGCVNPPPDITAVIDQLDRVACYGSADLSLEAHAVLVGGAIDCPGELEPGWLGCGGVMIELYALPDTGRMPDFVLVARSPNLGPSLFAVLHPSYEVDLGRGLDALVTVTGHFDDAGAQACRYTSWPDANPPAADEVVAGCRSTFVITLLEPLG